MSYSVTITDKEGNVLHSNNPHGIIGGTYCSDSTELYLNITFNYRKHFVRGDVFGSEGIKSLNGLTVEEARPLISKAIFALGNDISPDYWEATEGNARLALLNLLGLTHLAPNDSIIKIGY
jgi:hypothetical protein